MPALHALGFVTRPGIAVILPTFYGPVVICDVGANIALVDRNNYHLFQPLLYQVAMAGLSPGDIASPIRGLFSSSSTTTR